MGFFSRKKDKPPGPPTKPPARPPAPAAETLTEAIQRLDSSRGGEAKTTFMQLEQLTVSKAAIPKTSSKLLEKLKTQIAQLRVRQHGSTFNLSRDQSGNAVYDPLPERILGASIIKTKAALFLVGRTRSTWFVLYDTPHETLHDRNHKLMEVDLKKRDIAETPTGKRMYVSTITTADVNKLNAIAVMDARKEKAALPDSLALKEGVAFDYDATILRLQASRPAHCTDVYFDLDVFVANIRFMTPTQGDTGNYYYIEAGVENNPKTCELHVGNDPGMPAGTYEHKATIYYGNEPCFLYINVDY